MSLRDPFLTLFASQLCHLSRIGLLPPDAFTDGRHVRNSWLHAKVTGAMSRAVPPGFYPMLEVKWDRGFRPDLCVVDSKDQVVAVIEYESTNSSDERVIGKDLHHFERAISGCVGAPWPLPSLWMIVTTLPDTAVQHWPWHGWNEDAHYLPAQKSRAARNRSPFQYYHNALHTGFSSCWQHVKRTIPVLAACDLVWTNLADSGLTVQSVNGCAPDVQLSFSFRNAVLVDLEHQVSAPKPQ